MKTYKDNQNLKRRGSFLLSATTVLSLAAVLFFSASCGEDPTKTPEVEYYLTVSPKSVDFLNAGGKKSVTITSNIEDWSFKVDDDSWVTVEATSDGNVLELTAKPNPGGDRMTYLRLTSATNSSENKVLEVKQGLTTLNVTPEDVELDALGDYAAVTVETNIEGWTYSLDPEDASEWLTVVKDGDELQLTVGENTPGAGTRSADLIVKSTEFKVEKPVTVTQRAQDVYLTIAPKEPVEFESEGGDVTIAVTSNLDTWTYELDPLPEDDWLTVVKDGNDLKLTAKENTALTSRTTTLKVALAEFEKEETVQITQKDMSIYLTLDTDPIAMKPGGETVTIALTTNDANWTCSVEPVAAEEWLTLVKDGKNLKITATENPEAATRSATIKVGAGTLQETIAVSQAKVPIFDEDITASYLKNTGKPASPRFEYDADFGYVPLKTGVLSNRWYHVTDWKTNEQGRQNGNVDANNTFQYGLCLPGNGSPAQYPIVNGKLYQTIENLPAGSYRFIVTVRHKTKLNIVMVASKGDDLPDISGPQTGEITDMSQVLGFASIPFLTEISQTDTPFNVDFVLTEASNVSLGMVANVSAAQIIFYKVELWRASNP